MGIFDFLRRRGGAGAKAGNHTTPGAGGSIPPIPRALAALERRTTWIPQVADGEGAPRGCRIGGRPFLPRGEAWPACGVCREPLHLVVQLNSSELPGEIAERTGSGLFQMLYCLSECEVQADGWAPYSAVHCARRLDPNVDGEPGAGGRALAPRAITGWTAVDDLPHWEELPAPLAEELEAAYEACARPLVGDKLAGWPAWVQGVEYPACRICNRPMTMLFQIDSQDNLDWMWGDVGCAHLSQCAEHRDQLAFGWACA